MKGQPLMEIIHRVPLFRMRWTFLFPLLLCSWSVLALDAGVSDCDITPDTEAFRVPMAGYGARGGRPSQGVHDPLKAKVLCFRSGETRMALVTADLRSITPCLKNQILEKTSSLGFTADNLFVCASHTHAGPSMYPETFWQIQFGKYDPRIVEIMSGKIARSLQEAWEEAKPAKIGFAHTPVQGYTENRRWEHNQVARQNTGETPCVDSTLRLLRVDDMDGIMKALLVHFATHPTITGSDNFLLSAEWPGALQRTIESMCPGTTALFCNGAEGDQRPTGTQGQDAFARMEDFGKRLALEAIDLSRGMETLPDLSIASVHAKVELPSVKFCESALQGPFAFLSDLAKKELPRHAELQIFVIGDVALAGLPGEPLCAVGSSCHEALLRSGFRDAMVIGLANDYLGYIVNEEEYDHGGYEVEHRSFYGPSLGTFLVQEIESLAQTLQVPAP